MNLVVEIGGVAVGIEHDSPGWGREFAAAYGGFLSDSRPVMIIRARVVPGFSTGIKTPVTSMRLRGGGGYGLLWYDMEGEYFPSRGICRVTIAATAASISNVLRSMLAEHLPRKGGLMLHAAGFARNGAGYVFPGISGAGKSTLAALTVESRGDCELLTDEVSLVRPVKGAWMIYGTPFHGDVRMHGGNISVPLDRICFIAKSRNPSMQELSRADAYARLVQNSFQSFGHKIGSARVMDAASRLLDEVPAFEMGFRKDAGFWDLM
jgi:hypothetical protein